MVGGFRGPGVVGPAWKGVVAGRHWDRWRAVVSTEQIPGSEVMRATEARRVPNE
jgi:hypothetical protein